MENVTTLIATIHGVKLKLPTILATIWEKDNCRLNHSLEIGS